MIHIFGISSKAVNTNLKMPAYDIEVVRNASVYKSQFLIYFYFKYFLITFNCDENYFCFPKVFFFLQVHKDCVKTAEKITLTL